MKRCWLGDAILRGGVVLRSAIKLLRPLSCTRGCVAVSGEAVPFPKAVGSLEAFSGFTRARCQSRAKSDQSLNGNWELLS